MDLYKIFIKVHGGYVLTGKLNSETSTYVKNILNIQDNMVVKRQYNLHMNTVA